MENANSKQLRLDKSKQLFNKGNFLEAQEELTQLLNDLSNDCDHLLQAHALFQLAWTLRARGKQSTEYALLIDSELKALAERLNIDFIMALSHFRQGDRHFCDGRLRDAKIYWEQSLELIIKSNNGQTYEHAYILFHLGLLNRDLFGFISAIQYLTEALSIARELPLPYLIRQCLTELFFCYFYQNDIKSCLMCFDEIKNLNRGELTKIENHLLQAYIDIYNKKTISARKNLIKAFVACREQKIAKNRYDLYFHLSYFYALKTNFSKAWSFMRGCSDPIYQLMILQIEAQAKRELIKIKKYQKLANSTGITYHQQLAHILLTEHSKTILPITINLSRGKIKIKNQLVDISGREQIKNILGLFLRKSTADKQEILQTVFNFNHYDPVIHDSKVYRLVSQLNQIVGESVLVARSSYYSVSPLVMLINEESEYVPANVAIKEIILNIFHIHKNLSAKLIHKIFGSQKKFVLSEIEKLKIKLVG